MREGVTIKADRLAYLEAVLATLPECVAIIGRDLRLIDMNQAGLDKIGAASFDALPEGAPLALFSTPYQKAYRGALKAILSGDKTKIGRPFRVEMNSLTNEVFLMECRIAPLVDTNGDVDAVVITGRDVSGWDSALEEAKQSGSILQSILATVPDAMVVIDDLGSITSFSATAEALFGYDESEVLDKNVSMLMPSPHREAHDSYIEHYLRTKERRIIGIGRKVEGQKKDGSVFPMHLSVGEARIGEHCLFTGFIVDLTEKEKTEAEMQALQAELLHASRLSAVGTLASALAHEINQPLTAISNYLSAARDLVDDGVEDNKELFREAVSESVSESLRAGNIVRKLREFVAKGEINREILSIALLVEDATTLGLVGAYDKGISSSINIAPDANHVFVDRVQIQQVMVNLMRNAIEAMADSPVKLLNIGVKSISDHRIEIAVSDTGSGIDPEIVGKIFDPFASTKGTGMGLGLSICRTIVEAHEGKLTVEPNPDGGTIFRITLLKVEKEPDDDE